MSLCNMDIRKEIEKRRLKYYEVAAALNIDRATLSRWLALEMKPEKKAMIMKAIKGIKL